MSHEHYFESGEKSTGIITGAIASGKTTIATTLLRDEVVAIPDDMLTAAFADPNDKRSRNQIRTAVYAEVKQRAQRGHGYIREHTLNNEVSLVETIDLEAVHGREIGMLAIVARSFEENEARFIDRCDADGEEYDDAKLDAVHRLRLESLAHIGLVIRHTKTTNIVSPQIHERYDSARDTWRVYLGAPLPIGRYTSASNTLRLYHGEEDQYETTREIVKHLNMEIAQFTRLKSKPGIPVVYATREEGFAETPAGTYRKKLEASPIELEVPRRRGLE